MYTAACGKEKAGMVRVALEPLKALAALVVSVAHALPVTVVATPSRAVAETQLHENVGGVLGYDGSDEAVPSNVTASPMPADCSSPPAITAMSGSKGGLRSCVTVVTTGFSVPDVLVTVSTRVDVVPGWRVLGGRMSVADWPTLAAGASP